MVGEKYGFGIVGCGVISKWHACAIASVDDAKLVGVYDANLEKAKDFAKEYSALSFESYEAMLENAEIDVVCICTPSGLHAELAIMAANKGKHFLVEKPMAITEEGIKGIIEAVDKNGVKGGVVSQLRFCESVRRIKKAIEDGELGKIILGDVSMRFYRSAEYYASAGWRGTWEMDGGGALMNQGIHGIDVLQYLVGPAKSVHGMCRTLVHNIDVEDTANIMLEYENGAIGVIQGTTSVNPGYPRVITICGTRGTVELTGETITKWDVDGSRMDLSNFSSAEATNYRDPGGFSNEGHRLQILDMINAIKKDRAPFVDVNDSKNSLDIILGAYKSSKSGKTVFI